MPLEISSKGQQRDIAVSDYSAILFRQLERGDILCALIMARRKNVLPTLASLPPDMPVPARDSVRENRAFEEAEGDPGIPDAEEAEDLSTLRPEEEDAEVVEEE